MRIISFGVCSFGSFTSQGQRFSAAKRDELIAGVIAGFITLVFSPSLI